MGRPAGDPLFKKGTVALVHSGEVISSAVDVSGSMCGVGWSNGSRQSQGGGVRVATFEYPTDFPRSCRVRQALGPASPYIYATLELPPPVASRRVNLELASPLISLPPDTASRLRSRTAVFVPPLVILYRMHCNPMAARTRELIQGVVITSSDLWWHERGCRIEEP